MKCGEVFRGREGREPLAFVNPGQSLNIVHLKHGSRNESSVMAS